MAKGTIIQHFRTQTGGRVPTPSELEIGEFFFNVADGFVYYKKTDDTIVRLGETKEKVFNITTNGTNQFAIEATAQMIISFVINQLDYTDWVSINPQNSGNVVYDDSPTGGNYKTEIGDTVRIVYI